MKLKFKHPLIFSLPLFLVYLFLTGCHSTSKKQINQVDKTEIIAEKTNSLCSAYDYQLLNQDWRTTSLSTITKELKEADVIFIGEFHGNHASHLLQTQLLAALYQQNPKLILSMEMFNRDQQETLNEYIDGFIGEQTLINDAPAWPNYKASYRPSIEFAKQNLLPVIAANASGDIVRCIGSQGENYIRKLDTEELKWIAKQPFAKIPNYKEKFFGFMQSAKHGSNSERAQRTYLAQLTRDNTMAESIMQALKSQTESNSGTQVIHLNGTFHSENHLGTVGALKQLNPKLNIKVITPIHLDELSEAKADTTRVDDYYYVIQPQPIEYVQSENRRKAHKAMFAESRKKAKTCKQ